MAQDDARHTQRRGFGDYQTVPFTAGEEDET
jgi:hypothetical protein